MTKKLRYLYPSPFCAEATLIFYKKIYNDDQLNVARLNMKLGKHKSRLILNNDCGVKWDFNYLTCITYNDQLNVARVNMKLGKHKSRLILNNDCGVKWEFDNLTCTTFNRNP